MPPMRKISFLLLSVFLLSLSLSLPAQAELPLQTEPEETKAPKPLTGFEIYVRNFDKKFDKGGLNFVAGWTEILRQPAVAYKSSEKNKLLKASTLGVGKGLVYGLTDTVGGFVNALTSLLPGWEIPLPEGGITSEKVTGGNPEAFQDEDEYKIQAPDTGRSYTPTR